jgi:hypothetical protein
VGKDGCPHKKTLQNPTTENSFLAMKKTKLLHHSVATTRRRRASQSNEQENHQSISSSILRPQAKGSMKKRWFATAQGSANMSVTVPANIGKPSGSSTVYKNKFNLE